MRPFSSALTCLLLVLASSAAAQQSAPLHAPAARQQVLFGALYFPPKANAPFTATSRTVAIRILPDQSTVTVGNFRAVARDNDGRVFQERRSFVPDDGKQTSRVRLVQYDDPVAHTEYVCNPYSKVCQLYGYCGCVMSDLRRAGLQPDGTTYITREDLGPDTFEGLDVEHSRETYTFYKASIGNTNTILRTIEYWYSPALGVNLQEKIHDPRLGDETLSLTDVSLTALDPGVFQVPAQYRVVDHSNPRTMQPAQGNTEQEPQQ